MERYEAIAASISLDRRSTNVVDIVSDRLCRSVLEISQSISECKEASYHGMHFQELVCWGIRQVIV